MAVQFTTTAITRPHLIQENCWCNPVQCEHGLWIHKHLDTRPDEQPRMAVFSR